MSDKEQGPFWESRKFWMEIVAAGVFLTLALTETVTFTSQQVLIFVLGLAGIAVGGHTVTDVGAMIAAAITTKPAPPPAPTEEVVVADEVVIEPEPEEEEED